MQKKRENLAFFLLIFRAKRGKIAPKFACFLAFFLGVFKCFFGVFLLLFAAYFNRFSIFRGTVAEKFYVQTIEGYIVVIAAANGNLRGGLAV